MASETWVQLKSNLKSQKTCPEHVYFNATRRGVVIKVAAHGAEIECPKLFLMSRCPGIRLLIAPVESYLDTLDLSDEFPNVRVFQGVMTVVKGFRAIINTSDESDVYDVLSRWMGHGTFVCKPVEPIPQRIRIALRTDGQLLVKSMEEDYSGPDRTIALVAHGTEVKCSKFVLSHRVPALMPRVIPLPVPGGKLDVSDEVMDGQALEMLMKLIQGEHMDIAPPYDVHVRRVLMSWVYDPTHVEWAKDGKD